MAIAKAAKHKTWKVFILLLMSIYSNKRQFVIKFIFSTWPIFIHPACYAH